MVLYYQDERFKDLLFFNLENDELLKFLYLNDFRVNGNWSDDNPVLHCLLANEKYDYVDRLLKLIPERIDPNICDGKRFGKKSLLIMLTLMPVSDEIVINFIKTYHSKLNFNYQDSFGRTALHYAVILGRTDIFKALIEAGASPEIKDHLGEQPLNYLNCSDKLILDTFQLVDVEGKRDENATSNAVKDLFKSKFIFTRCKTYPKKRSH